MIVSIVQKYNGVECSYVTPEGKIDVMFFKIANEANRFTVWERTKDGKPDKHWPNKVDLTDHPVRLVYARKFDRFSLINFLNNLPKETKDLLFSAQNQLQYFSFDIETEIDKSFPHPELAEQRICSIATTSPDDSNTTVVQTIYPLTQEECEEVTRIVNDWLYVKHKAVDRPVNVSVVQHQSEREMMWHFVNNIWSKAPMMSGWNTNGFDFPYIENRCKKIGIDISGASPVKTLDWKGKPLHRVDVDAMQITKDFDVSAGYIESFSLDYVGKKFLNLPKLDYSGYRNLKELYEKNKVLFTAYNVIDTINVELLHKARGTINALYGLAASAGMPLSIADGAVAQSEFVMFNEMLTNPKYEHIVWAVDSSFGDLRPYAGGFVKQPVRPYGKYLACFDYSSLYPSLMRTCNISPELFIRKLTEEDRRPENFKKLLTNPTYFIGVEGSLYDNREDGLYKIVETKLYKDRKIYQKCAKVKMLNRNIINEEFKRRGLATRA